MHWTGGACGKALALRAADLAKNACQSSSVLFHSDGCSLKRWSSECSDGFGSSTALIAASASWALVRGAAAARATHAATHAARQAALAADMAIFGCGDG